MEFEITPLGDSGVMIRFGHRMNLAIHQYVISFVRLLEHVPIAGVTEIVPGIASVAVYYDPILLYDLQNSKLSPFEWMSFKLKELCGQMSGDESTKSRVLDIPVCYGGEFGPDLDYVASYHGLTPQEVIDIHSKGSYLVYMMGFTPGFPYLGGMDERIATPRLNSPRLSIPIGSVGIGGNQTGIYPIESPGGWQLIGRTPLDLFCPQYDPPCLINTGDVIYFRPITSVEFDRLRRKNNEY